MYSVHVHLISICTYVHLVIAIGQSRALRLRQDLNPRHTVDALLTELSKLHVRGSYIGGCWFFSVL